MRNVKIDIITTIIVIIASLFGLFFSGCIEQPENQNQKIKMESENISLGVELPFENAKDIPSKYTCDGEDISPWIKIYGISKDAKSIAIIVEDPDAPLRTFTHWMIWNIPAKENITIPENIPTQSSIEDPISAVQGKNDFGKFGYGGPCPPYGKHRYFFKIYVLDTNLDLTPEAKKKDLQKSMEGHILQYKEIYGVYERKR